MFKFLESIVFHEHFLFEWCNIPSQVHRGAVKAYGELKDFQDLVHSEAGDGSRSSEIFSPDLKSRPGERTHPD